jgi:PAS domain-containing protein
VLQRSDELEISLMVAHADGSQLHFAFSLSRFRHAPAGGAASTCTLGVGRDLTDLGRAAASASQEVHDLRRLIDCANAPIFGINAAALITEWNRKATKITGAVPHIRTRA